MSPGPGDPSLPGVLLIKEISGQGLVREEKGEKEREAELLCSRWLAVLSVLDCVGPQYQHEGRRLN